jgi:hypothetical protein
MTYLAELSAEIEQGVPSNLLPRGDTKLLFRLYALLALVKGADVTAADVHNAWAVWMEQQDPHHRSIRPFEELDIETQKADEPFATAIRAAAERFRLHQA